MTDDTLQGSTAERDAWDPLLADTSALQEPPPEWQADGVRLATAEAGPVPERFLGPATDPTPEQFQGPASDFAAPAPEMIAAPSPDLGAAPAASATAVRQVATTGNVQIDGLVDGYAWNVSTLTYSFPTASSTYGTTDDDKAVYGSNEPWSGTFQALNPQQARVLQAIYEGHVTVSGSNAVSTYGSIASFTNLNFVFNGSGSADLQSAIADVNNPTAYAYTPWPDYTDSGDIWFGSGYFGPTASQANPTLGSYGYITAMHEVGHSLGLKHPHELGSFDEPTLPTDVDSLEFTVMSYRSYINAPLNGYTNETFGYPTTPMMLDIQALQKLYGADYTLNASNTTYSWSPTTGEMSVNGVGQGQPGGNRIFLTIWDGGGRDAYNMANYTNGVSVDLNPGKWSVNSQDQLAILDVGFSGSVIKSRGTVFNALLFNNDTASMIEDAVGGTGDDTIFGNQAGNSLVGGGGADILYGGAGGDTLSGGDAADRIYGSDSTGSGTDADSLDAGAGNDTILGAGGADTILGGGGNDSILAGGGDNRIDGGAGGDTIYAGAGNDSIFTGDGDNYVNAGDGSNTVIGGTGSDTVLTGAGNDYILTDANDSIVSGDGNDTIDTGIDNDTIDAGAGNDSINAGDGEDIVQAGADNDTVFGGSGNDSIDGGSGDDWLDGGADNDTILGGAGSDSIDGGAGNDLIVWHTGDGNDTILGGLGNDTLLLDGWTGPYDVGTDVILKGAYGSWNVSGSASDRVLVNGTTTIHAAGFDAVACFAAGTRIATARGEVPVESLRLGDLVVTAGPGAGLRPTRWLGRTRVEVARHPDRAAIAPVRVRAGALGGGVPHRDLRVSPDHALHLDGHLVPAGLLVNGTTILQELWCPSVEYWHVELDSHALLVADGALAESYLDDGNRGQFDNSAFVTLFRDFARERANGRYDRDACLPVLRSGARLTAIRESLPGQGNGSRDHARLPA